MNTQSVVNELNRLNPDWSSANLLDVVNNITKLLIKTELEGNIYLDPTTGDLPYLATTAGTYQYTPAVAGKTFWKIASVVVDANLETENRPLWSSNAEIVVNAGDYGPLYSPVSIMGKRYIKAPCRALTEAQTGSSPSILFRYDPGTTTTTFKFAGYQSPAEILSLTTPIPIDDRYRYDVVIPACQTMIDALDNGRYQDGVDYIVTKLRPKLQYGLEKETQGCFTENYSY